ncbi:protein IQ-DOMAIN 9 [Nicotiana tabacum]|uniref:Protein IQ-DOMAIN 1 n=3 Tax=Nicotiana tabacum TaxID=4097 RepID=A0A1S3YTF6_TOBAC|nr:PREDICTED: protein IQ-DOMAIN 1-like [Nicotiana tabacum]XP_016455296.1 PREDICTED: protein IQ-DOMAIN 1-like [Nicotiana tabacum]XP_016455297.1 PREDICTED: protein IQ-DOMAIN 1-like [Nicotiana tabacum]XP_016455298.1 PREDICTED: protein IQ-DOMAIN 1-like [Nicotiana tabacum]
MGSADWLKNVIGMRKAKDGKSKKLKGTSAIKKSNGCKGDEPLQKEPSKITNGVLIKNQRELGMPIDDRVAIKIQTAFRAYVARKTLRRLKGNARLQFLTQHPSVKKQASSALNYIHSWNRMQTEIRDRRVRMVTEGRLERKKLENQLKLEAKLQNLEVEWSGGPETMEVILARIHHREEAATKRERAMAYAFSHQWRANSSPVFGSCHEMSKANWGWSWTDRWVAARPWESRVPVLTSPKKVNGKASKTTKSSTTPTKKTPISVKSNSPHGKGTVKAKKSNEVADKVAAQKVSSKVKETGTEKQEVVVEAN